METIHEAIQWPGWETVRLIGRGSFGAVYEIHRELPNGKIEKAALKVISIPQNQGDIEEMLSDGYDSESIAGTFNSHLKSIAGEYSLMGKLRGSPNVVNCDDVRFVQHEDGIGWDIFIKMELLTPLAKAMPEHISEQMVLKVGVDICKALALFAKYNNFHRGINSQNIFVSANGDYKLGDFGVAKVVEGTFGNARIGRYACLAPEFYNDQPCGATMDIYSLGLVMYRMLNERRMPFMPLPPAFPTPAQQEKALQRRFSGEPIPEPRNGSDELKRIVQKACAYDPKARYHTAEEMLADLEAIQLRLQR